MAADGRRQGGLRQGRAKRRYFCPADIVSHPDEVVLAERLPAAGRLIPYRKGRSDQFTFASINAAVVSLNFGIEAGCTYIMCPAS